MPSMPHVIMKGNIFSALEDGLSGLGKSTAKARADRIKALNHFYNEPHLGTQAGMAPSDSAHNDKDWYGFAQGTSAQPPFGPANTRTGWWNGFYGFVDGIVRDTFIRAIEVSLGFTHNAGGYRGTPEVVGVGANKPSTFVPTWPSPTRLWAISVVWICGAPKFEGWVTWQKTGNGQRDGVVNVIFTTPGPQTSPSLSLSLNRIDTPSEKGILVKKPQESPPDAVGDKGVWVVGHADLDLAYPPAFVPAPPAKYDIGAVAPGFTLVGTGPLIVVKPALEDGGLS